MFVVGRQRVTLCGRVATIVDCAPSSQESVENRRRSSVRKVFDGSVYDVRFSDRREGSGSCDLLTFRRINRTLEGFGASLRLYARAR